MYVFWFPTIRQVGFSTRAAYLVRMINGVSRNARSCLRVCYQKCESAKLCVCVCLGSVLNCSRATRVLCCSTLENLIRIVLVIHFDYNI